MHRRISSEVVELVGTSAPSGIALVDDALLVCGYVAGEVRRYELGTADFDVVANGCRYDVVVLPDGRLAMAVDDGVLAVAL